MLVSLGNNRVKEGEMNTVHHVIKIAETCWNLL